MADGDKFKSPKGVFLGDLKTPSKSELRSINEWKALAKGNREYASSIDSEIAGREILEAVQKAEREGRGAGSGMMAIHTAINALIMASQTTAAIGSLDPQWQYKLQLVIEDKTLLDRVARAYWWGEDY
jgi:hypothetical protein